MKYHCIRGVKDLQGIPSRRGGISKYDTKKPLSIHGGAISSTFLILAHELIDYDK